jgi:hypothetical protein
MQILPAGLDGLCSTAMDQAVNRLPSLTLNQHPILTPRA